MLISLWHLYSIAVWFLWSAMRRHDKPECRHLATLTRQRSARLQMKFLCNDPLVLENSNYYTADECTGLCVPNLKTGNWKLQDYFQKR
jgi:hypothetical protein